MKPRCCAILSEKWTILHPNIKEPTKVDTF